MSFLCFFCYSFFELFTFWIPSSRFCGVVEAFSWHRRRNPFPHCCCFHAKNQPLSEMLSALRGILEFQMMKSNPFRLPLTWTSCQSARLGSTWSECACTLEDEHYFRWECFLPSYYSPLRSTRQLFLRNPGNTNHLNEWKFVSSFLFPPTTSFRQSLTLSRRFRPDVSSISDSVENVALPSSAEGAISKSSKGTLLSWTEVSVDVSCGMIQTFFD